MSRGAIFGTGTAGNVFPVNRLRVEHRDLRQQRTLLVHRVQRRRVARIVVRPQHAWLGPAHRQTGSFAQVGRQRRELFDDARRIGPPALEVGRPGAALEVLFDPRPEGNPRRGQHQKRHDQFCSGAGHHQDSTFCVLLAYREEREYAPLSVTVMSRWRRRNRDRDLDEELRDHVERQTEQNIRRGMTPEQARRQALLQFGNVPLVKEDTRAVWTRVGVEQLLQDLRFGARILTRSPGLSATAAILIALVIGINTTIFSMVNGMVRRPAPGMTADDLVQIALADRPGAGFFSVPDYLEYQKQTKTLRALTAFTNRRVNMTLDRGTYPAFLTAVDANYFETVGVSVALGRGFTRADGELSGTTGLTAVISDQTWKNHFWGASDVVGRRIDVNGIPATIIGVAPPLFRGTMAAERADLWLPLLAFWRVLMPEAAQRFVVDRAAGSVDLIGRLAPGRRVSEAQAESASQWSRIRPGLRTRDGLALFSIVTLLTVLIVSANV